VSEFSPHDADMDEVRWVPMTRQQRDHALYYGAGGNTLDDLIVTWDEASVHPPWHHESAAHDHKTS
jgi:hypothetical protein